MNGKSNLQLRFPLSELKALLTRTDFEGQADKSFNLLPQTSMGKLRIF